MPRQVSTGMDLLFALTLPRACQRGDPLSIWITAVTESQRSAAAGD